METKETAAHPLLEKNIDCIVDWKEWKEHWRKETRADFLHSLLHFGFEVEVYSHEEAVERICLYLDIANGAFDYRTFRSYSHGSGGRPPCRFGKDITDRSDLQYILSRKAFQMLCQQLFKNTSEDDVPSWLRITADQQVFSKLLWFLRLDEDGRIYNLFMADGHNAKIARNFAEEFCCFIWKCQEINSLDYIPDGIRETFRKGMPSMIEILFGLRKLDLLLARKRYETIDAECEEKLQELALSFKLYISSDGVSHRKPKTVEEACFAGSQAAQVLLVVRTMRAEATKFKQLQELETQRREAEEKIKNLS